MLGIWLVIIAGIVLVPIISSFSKDLEERIENEDVEALGGKIKGKEEVKQLNKVLTYIVIGIIVVIAIIMIVYIRGSIAAK